MRIHLSVALTADDCIDDRSSERLIISSAQDWSEVYRLRSLCDAILIGGETLRRDNPSLCLKDEMQREQRKQSGRCEELTKIVVSRDGELDPLSRFFNVGTGRNIVFSNVARPELHSVADVIVADRIDASFIVTTLEKMGIGTLMVEGGAQMLTLFVGEGLFDEFRVARNPNIVIADPLAPHFTLPDCVLDLPFESVLLGGVEVRVYNNRSYDSEHVDRRLRSEEDTSELQSHSEIAYDAFCSKKKYQ